MSLDLECPSNAAIGSSVDAEMLLENEECFPVSFPRAFVAIGGNIDRSLGGAGTTLGPSTAVASGTIPAAVCQFGIPVFPAQPGRLGPLSINVTDSIPPSPDGAVAAVIVSLEASGTTETGRTAKGLVSDSCFVVVGDEDLDGVADGEDNCVLEPNPDQSNIDEGTDDDSSLAGIQHYGDACDADLNNDGIVNTADFFDWFRPCFGADLLENPPCARADLDGNGTVNTADFFGSFRSKFGAPPGPGMTH